VSNWQRASIRQDFEVIGVQVQHWITVFVRNEDIDHPQIDVDNQILCGHCKHGEHDKGDCPKQCMTHASSPARSGAGIFPKQGSIFDEGRSHAPLSV
jgi:hypothetical protein